MNKKRWVKKRRNQVFIFQKSLHLTSIDPTVFDLLVNRRYIAQNFVIEDTMEYVVVKCISEHFQRSKGDHELPDIEKAIRNVRNEMSVLGAESCIDTLRLHYRRVLK